MTGSMAGSFTVHLESAGKCSHEMTGNCETPKGAGAPNAKKKSVSPFREISIVGQIMKPISIHRQT